MSNVLIRNLVALRDDRGRLQGQNVGIQGAMTQDDASRCWVGSGLEHMLFVRGLFSSQSHRCSAPDSPPAPLVHLFSMQDMMSTPDLKATTPPLIN